MHVIIDTTVNANNQYQWKRLCLIDTFVHQSATTLWPIGFDVVMDWPQCVTACGVSAEECSLICINAVVGFRRSQEVWRVSWLPVNSRNCSGDRRCSVVADSSPSLSFFTRCWLCADRRSFFPAWTPRSQVWCGSSAKRCCHTCGEARRVRASQCFTSTPPWITGWVPPFQILGRSAAVSPLAHSSSRTTLPAIALPLHHFLKLPRAMRKLGVAWAWELLTAELGGLRTDWMCL